jgi:hypothetical protein
VFCGHSPTHAVRPSSSFKICSFGNVTPCALAAGAALSKSNIAAMEQPIDFDSIMQHSFGL